MKRIYFLVALVSLACPFICCKSKKSTTTSAETITATADNTSKFRIIVSFISKGAGTDSKLRADFIKFIESHHKHPAYSTIQWGREGEADYCLTLKELTEKEKVAFVNDLKNLIGKTDMVFISENAESQHKR